jgi:hypothetical protein
MLGLHCGLLPGVVEPGDVEPAQRPVGIAAVQVVEIVFDVVGGRRLRYDRGGHVAPPRTLTAGRTNCRSDRPSHMTIEQRESASGCLPSTIREYVDGDTPVSVATCRHVRPAAIRSRSREA